MWISRTLNRMCPFFCPGYAHVQVWSTSLMMIHHVCEFWSKCLEGNIPFYQSTSCVDVINKIIRTSSLYIKSLQYLTAHIIYNTKLPSQIITVLVCDSFTLNNAIIITLLYQILHWDYKFLNKNSCPLYNRISMITQANYWLPYFQRSSSI